MPVKSHENDLQMFLCAFAASTKNLFLCSFAVLQCFFQPTKSTHWNINCIYLSIFPFGLYLQSLDGKWPLLSEALLSLGGLLSLLLCQGLKSGKGGLRLSWNLSSPELALASSTSMFSHVESGSYLILSHLLPSLSKSLFLITLAGRDPVACGEGLGISVLKYTCILILCVFARGVRPGFGDCGVHREQILPAVLRISFLWELCWSHSGTFVTESPPFTPNNQS